MNALNGTKSENAFKDVLASRVINYLLSVLFFIVKL